jgi:hypothetical protein
MDNKIKYKYCKFLMNKLNMNQRIEDKILDKISKEIKKIENVYKQQIKEQIEYQEYVFYLKKLDLVEIQEINTTEEWKKEMISEIINQNITIRNKKGVDEDS